MQRIEVAGERGSYAVLVGAGLLDRLAATLDDEGVGRPQALVTDRTVGPLHGRRLAEALGLGSPLELDSGEEHKRWPAVERTCGHWLEAGVRRRGLVLAVGGGVVTDTVGFAAAVYLRGVDWMAAPTTLLAMVDAAVGGKTGVNLDQGKNLVGAFWAPRLVVADVATLATLPARELRAGLVEALKSAWIGDHGLLAHLEGGALDGYRDRSPEAWEELVARAVAVKAALVTADEHEAGPRQALNLGHTIGHALEAVTAYRRFLHGEAVGWGLVAVAELARRRGLLGTAARARLGGALTALGPWPPVADLDSERVLAHLGRDKKADRSGVAWVLPTDDGVLVDQRVGRDELVSILDWLRRRG